MPIKELLSKITPQISIIIFTLKQVYWFCQLSVMKHCKRLAANVLSIKTDLGIDLSDHTVTVVIWTLLRQSLCTENQWLLSTHVWGNFTSFSSLKSKLWILVCRLYWELLIYAHRHFDWRIIAVLTQSPTVLMFVDIIGSSYYRCYYASR